MSFSFSSLEQTPLGISRAEMMAAIQPYVARECTAADPQWQAALAKVQKGIGRDLLKKMLLGWKKGVKRTVETTEANYTVGWARTNWEAYAATAPRPANGSPWEWGATCMLANSIIGARSRLWCLMQVIEHLKPRSVLEVGSGPGVNLLPLSCRFPDIRFEGIELSKGGVAKSQASQQCDELPPGLQSFSPEPLVDVTAHKRVTFTQGSAAEMPFRDGQFDLVYSSLALEQMEPIRPQALREFARVAGRHTAMFEPFADVNQTPLRRKYVRAHEYFQGAIADLPSYGLKPVWGTDDIPQKLWLGAALVVSEKV